MLRYRILSIEWIEVIFSKLFGMAGISVVRFNICDTVWPVVYDKRSSANDTKNEPRKLRPCKHNPVL